MIFQKKKLTSFDTVTLRLSGMRFFVEYEIVCREAACEITEYSLVFNSDKEERVPKRRVERPTDEVMDVLRGSGVAGWDGFHGSHPKGVLDGTMFTLNATVNDGQKIYASGSQNFPHGFQKLRDYIEKTVRGV